MHTRGGAGLLGRSVGSEIGPSPAERGRRHPRRVQGEKLRDERVVCSREEIHLARWLRPDAPPLCLRRHDSPQRSR